jgi:MerR family transcriptional regulator, light-induced transcriptional regulator
MTVRPAVPVVKGLCSVCRLWRVDAYLRIGELSRRTNVSRELLRAWERRYGLLQPTRSDGGFRLYSDQDELRIRLMQGHLERGLSAAEAARLALAEQEEAPAIAPATDASPPLARGARDLRAALDALDESAAHTAIDRMLAELSVESFLRDVVLPYLRELGDRWARGEISVGYEHFASNVLRGRLLGLARGWDRGAGPRALLACPPGELHDLGLIVFGLGLRDRGWRITFLGADTPLDTLTDTAGSLAPDAVVLAASSADRFDAHRDAIRRLALAAPLWLAGDGATPETASASGTRVLDADPLGAAERVASTH